jgi:hypothetical protein
MAGTRILPSDDLAAPLLGISGAILAGAAGLFLLIYFLCQPTVSANPGVAAYAPPPATRLVPLPRISDAPELAELSVDSPSPPSPLSALAQARAGDQPAKPPPRPVARKRPRVEPIEREQRNVGFAQPWNFGYRSSPSNEHAWSGGPRSWF